MTDLCSTRRQTQTDAISTVTTICEKHCIGTTACSRHSVAFSGTSKILGYTKPNVVICFVTFVYIGIHYCGTAGDQFSAVVPSLGFFGSNWDMFFKSLRSGDDAW